MVCVAVGDVGRRIGGMLGRPPAAMPPAEFARRLSERTGLTVTPQRVHNWISGAHDPPNDLLPSIASVLSKSVNWLLGEPEGLMEVGASAILGESSQSMIPKIGSVYAGDWSDPTDSEDFEFVDSEMVVKGAFCSPIRGDSMYDFLRDGDLAIWKKWEVGGQVNDIVVARNSDGQLTVKQLKVKGDQFFLHPLNPAYRDQPLLSNPIGYLLGYIRRHGDGTKESRFNPNRLRP